MKRRLIIAASLFIFNLSSGFAAENIPFSPQPPQIHAGSWVLMDYTTGQILTAGNEHQQRNPASLTKLMTGYVVDRAIDSHRITPDDIVTVGRDAWAKDNPVFVGSSLMFLKEGDRVSVRDLSRGLIVDSGNDACVALADYIAGGQRQFVEMMNNYAEKLHLKDTHFETVHGLDAPGQHSSAYDLAVLSRAIIHGEPEFYHMYSEKSLTWNGITQQNRNGLLWDKTMNVDGLKTGHTSGAGFNLIASAVDGQRRLIAVVMGADSAKGREEEARKLLRWGQQNFTTVQILHRGKKVGTERIWYGDKENIDLGTEQEFWMVLPKAEIPHIKAKYTLDGKELTAPISAHQRVPLMLVWCAAAMFLCGWLALGKKPYQGLLIGVTLAIVVGSPTGEIDTALWRSGDVILGSLLAMLFTGIWPQRAFIHWRIQLAKSLTEYNRVYQSAFSPNLLERPRLESHLQKLLTDAVKMRGLIAPASKETRIPKSIYEGIQTINRNLVCMLELQINAYWATRPSHFVLLNAQKLRDTQHMMQQILLSLVHALYEGNPQPVFANTEKLNDAVEELRQLLDNHHDLKVVETPIYGYVWLNMETAHQLELLSNLICRALRK